MAQKITGKQGKYRHGTGKKRKCDKDQHRKKGGGKFFKRNKDRRFDDKTPKKHGNE